MLFSVMAAMIMFVWVMQSSRSSAKVSLPRDVRRLDRMLVSRSLFCDDVVGAVAVFVGASGIGV